MIRRVVCGDNMEVLSTLDDESIDLIYIDPPFNTGHTQRRHLTSYEDSFSEFESFIRPRLDQSHRLLVPTGSLFFHIDYRESHYCKIWLDKVFGRDNFRNEIIWAYDYGARSRKKWSTKHDNIFWYSKSDEYTFNYDEMDRIPYMAPGLQKDKDRAEKGKTPTDCFTPDTEILTRAGWKYIPDVRLTDEVMTINRQHEIEYQYPSKLHINDHDSDIIESVFV